MTNKSTQQDLKYRGKAKKLSISSGIIVFLIAISPYLFYIYESFPDKQVWETSLFTWETHYASFQHFAWYLTGKLIPLYLLLIWFFTCKHWWHWIILIPITMYIFQTWGIVNQSLNFDEVELIYMLPVMLVLVPTVYLIRAKIFHRIRDEDLTDFEEDLKQKKTFVQQLKELFR